MNIYLIRHGKVDNPNNIYYGRLPNFNLLESATNEIKETGKFLQNKNIEIIISSPMERAMQTGEIIKKMLKLNSKKTIISSQINEVKTSFQGREVSELKKINFDIYSTKNRTKGDETMKQVAFRMKKFIICLSLNYKNKEIVAVSHGDPIAIIKAYIQNKPLSLNIINSYEYPKHGEIIKIEVKKNTILSAISIFKPSNY